MEEHFRRIRQRNRLVGAGLVQRGNFGIFSQPFVQRLGHGAPVEYVFSNGNPARLDQGAHLADIIQGTNPVLESEFVWNDTGVLGEFSLGGPAAGKHPAPQQDIRRIEVLSGERRRKFTHRARSFLIAQSCARENELEVAPMIPLLESAHQKSYINSLSARIRVGLVQHHEP
jgi:hypothetical protein